MTMFAPIRVKIYEAAPKARSGQLGANADMPHALATSVANRDRRKDACGRA